MTDKSVFEGRLIGWLPEALLPRGIFHLLLKYKILQESVTEVAWVGQGQSESQLSISRQSQGQSERLPFRTRYP
jgi:hypothetical protein